MVHVVQEDTVLRMAKVSCLFLFRTLAANDIATAAGGSEVDYWVRQLRPTCGMSGNIGPEPYRDREHRSNEGPLFLTGVGRGGLA